MLEGQFLTLVYYQSLDKTLPEGLFSIVEVVSAFVLHDGYYYMKYGLVIGNYAVVCLQGIKIRALLKFCLRDL